MARSSFPADPLAVFAARESEVADLTRVEAARAGDREALSSIYESHAPALVRRLRLYVGSSDLADDLVQDTFVVAFGDLERFRHRSTLSTWLHGIAFNLARQAIRKRTRRAELRERAGPAISAEPSAHPEELTAAAELGDRMRATIAALKPELREAFILRVIEALSLREAADISGVRVSTLSHRARKAEEIVRRAFEEESK
jgi:RNA polymerase sigma-70 factor (ECF subfamily)